MISTISLPYSNLNTSPLPRMFDNESLDKVISSPLTLFIEVLPVIGREYLFSVDLDYTSFIKNQGSHVALIS